MNNSLIELLNVYCDYTDPKSIKAMDAEDALKIVVDTRAAIKLSIRSNQSVHWEQVARLLVRIVKAMRSKFFALSSWESDAVPLINEICSDVTFKLYQELRIDAHERAEICHVHHVLVLLRAVGADLPYHFRERSFNRINSSKQDGEELATALVELRKNPKQLFSTVLHIGAGKVTVDRYLKHRGQFELLNEIENLLYPVDQNINSTSLDEVLAIAMNPDA